MLSNDKNNSAIIAITDADFISNEIVTSSPTDNINFAVNSIEWLADNSGLIQLRNKFTTFSLLEPIEDYNREFLKFLNFFMPILIIAIVAFVRYRRKKRKRIERLHSLD